MWWLTDDGQKSQFQNCQKYRWQNQLIWWWSSIISPHDLQSGPIWSFLLFSPPPSENCNLLKRQKESRQLPQGKLCQLSTFPLHNILFLTPLLLPCVNWSKLLGEFWCQLVQYLIVVTALVSIYTLVLMSVARLSLLLLLLFSMLMLMLMVLLLLLLLLSL